MRVLHARRAAAAVAGVGLFLGLAVAPAAAGDLPVSGSFAGTGELTSALCQPPPADSAGIGAGFDNLTGTLTSIGDTQLSGAVCLTTDGVSRVYGPLTLVTATGSISATMTGTGTSGSGGGFGPFDWHLTATVTGGTGAYEAATGTLTLDMHMEFIFPLQWTGTIDGTVTVPPHTPMSKDDCRNGGWRNFEDEEANPFPNQGQCIAWVNHHT